MLNLHLNIGDAANLLKLFDENPEFQVSIDFTLSSIGID